MAEEIHLGGLCWYRFNGREIGTVGNNGTLDLSYSQSISDRTATNGTGAFRHGSDYGSSYASFGEAYAGLNSYAQGSSGGSVTAQGGDTLASIASRLWGDSALWYKLAEANGLSSGATLADGQVLSIPAGVSRASNTASTFKPYDPAETLGDTSPTTPKPAKNNKCGGIGAILVAVVAIAVTAIATAGIGALATGAPFSSSLSAVTGGTLAGLTSTVTGATALGSTGAVLAGVGGAVVGSIASQGLGIALGLQKSINWSGVALAGISAGVSGGLSGVSPFGANAKGLAAIGNIAARGALSSAVTQGIGIATGLQSKFDFAGVAAAGLSAAVGGALKGHFTAGVGNSFSFGEQLLTNTASGITNAAARSLINGSDFGDNLLAALPDIIGQTVGGRLLMGLPA